MFRNLRIGQKLLAVFIVIPVVVSAIGWFGIRYVGNTGLMVSNEYAPHVDALMEVKLAATDAHLNLEELITGDDSRSMEVVRRLLDEADWYLDVVITGGTNSEGTYVPTTDSVLRGYVRATQRELAALRAAAEGRFANRRSGNEGVGSDSDQAFDAAFDRFIATSDRAESRAQQRMNAGAIRVREIQGEARTTMLVLTALATLVSVLLAVWMTRHLTQPVMAAAKRSQRVADGNLTEQSGDKGDDDRGDEIGLLLRNFTSMQGSIREAMKAMQAGARVLATQSQEAGSTAAEYAASASQQTRAVQEASASVEELRQLAESSLRFAREVVDSSEHAAERGHRGIQAVGSAVETMDGVVARVDAIVQSIRELSDRNQRVREIVDTVNELAEQSNLLAVNASIEAAQAGEHGRGFAVVATEVRNLASQSKRSAQQIRGLLAEIERATADAVGASKDGSQRATEGKATMRSVRDVIDELAAALEGSSERARKIAASAAEQAQATGQVSDALRGIADSGRAQLAGVTSLENAAARLAKMSESQRELTDRYTL
jgi:methyl-accepting chemotaxis protein